MTEETKSKDARLTRAAGVVSIAVMGSRVLGLVREMVLAYFFEAKLSLDAFYAAFRIPNLLRDLFGEGILSKAFVTTFTDIEVKEGEKTAWRLASMVFNALALILGIITLLGILLSPFIVDIMFFGKGFAGVPLPHEGSFGIANKRDLTVYLTRIMFPFILVVSLAAIAMGLLNSKGRFFIPASASSFFNAGSVVIGCTGYYIAPKFGQHPTVGMAVGVLVGGALQFLVQVPSMWRVGYRYRPLLSFTDRGVKQVMRLVTPMVLGAAAVQVNVLVNSIFASHGEGWLTWITQSFRLMHLPIGVFGVAISTASLPILSRYIAEGKMESYRHTISHALRLMILLTVPASIGLMALKEPIIRLLYQRGAFDATDTLQVANALFCYAFGLCGYSALKIATDGFYALKDTKTPVYVSLCTIALNIILNYLFIFQFNFRFNLDHFDHRSLALSTSCTLTANFTALFIILNRRVGNFGVSAIASVFGRVILASLAMGIVCWWTSGQIATHLGTDTLWASLAQVGVPIALGLVVLYIACRILRITEMNNAIRAVSEKFLSR